MPTLLFGLLAGFAVNDAVHSRSAWYFLGLFVAAVMAYFFMKALVFDLADDVFDAGNTLVVRFGKDRRRIPLAEIMNVSYSPLMSPPRVVLSLQNDGMFGKEVAFAAQISLLPFAKNLTIPALIARIGSARVGEKIVGSGFIVRPTAEDK